MHPGKLLREDILFKRVMSEMAVADASKIFRQTLQGMLNEKQPVTAGMPARLGKLLDNGGTFWVNLQGNHDPARAGRTVDVSGIWNVGKGGCGSPQPTLSSLG